MPDSHRIRPPRSGPALALASLLAAPCSGADVASAPAAELEEIVVTASLREVPLAELPASATVLPAATLRDAGVQHFEDVLSLVPNLNWAAGSSRPRYFQIRGIGELEQYEGAPNPSVGFLIDDVDFSGIGMPATLFDVGQIEVLRGPQGTRYGANALAGLIAVRGRDPERSFGVETELTAGEYADEAAGIAVTGPVAALDSAWRVSVQRARSDGFLTNTYLGRDDTNSRDETSARFKWRWQPGDATRLDLTLLDFDLDNGYDAFAIDNSRTTLSNDPGQDSQRATAGALDLAQKLSDQLELEVIATVLDSASVHAYDGDWGNPRDWAPYTYDFTYRADRDRRVRSLDLRLVSHDGPGIAWLIGGYALDLEEQIHEVSVGTYVDPFADYTLDVDDRSVSHYDARTYALYGQLDGHFGATWHWSAGLRGEQRASEYRASDIAVDPPVDLPQLSSRDRMLGGQISLSRDLGAVGRAYLSLSRGYKAGGYNLSPLIPDERRHFDPEYLVSVELGLHAIWFDGRLDTDLALFDAHRRDVQVRTGEQLVAGDPNSFVFYTANAAQGRNSGVEASVNWHASATLDVYGTLGLLDAKFENFDPGDGTRVDREQPHAPSYQASLGAEYRHPAGWLARVDVNAVDAFYFDVPPIDARSDPYWLANLRMGYAGERFEAYLWVRNLFDEDYATRGFFFGNEPPDFPAKVYVQLGDPRQIGATVRLKF